MSDINETIRLAGEGAEELQIVSVVNKNPTLMKSVAAIRALIAKASETCEWKQKASGSVIYMTSCGHMTITYAPSYNFCHHCGRKLTETPLASK